MERLLAAMGDPDLRVRLPSGAEVGAPRERARGTVWLRDRGAVLRALLDPELQFGELYTAGRLVVEGDLVGLLEAALRAEGGAGWLRRLVPRRLVDGVLRQDERRAADNARHHYDVSNDFYRLWLDERMVYTCAYFPTPAATLEDAQLAKMDHVCRKLALRRGEHVVEAGSGWGSLALHMARYYGVTVRAYNVSREQVAWAREQAEKQGLAERVEFVLDDWRHARGPCDAFVSVGMLEHVGVSHYEELGRVIDRCLAPAGRGLVHTIGRAR
ncbi:MAG: cyclopropane-fatty-acyl-phospholipid synthase family protein, partial [Myxococcota bacterium]|nr:cyclopropane-fatty-acyl-phospholipid synthase family protein [Myxococcota bacterium]